MRLPEVDVAEYSGGAPPVCQSTLATRFASSARSRRGSDDRGARVPWRPGFGQEWTSFPIARLRKPQPRRVGRCIGATAIFGFTFPTGWLPRQASTPLSPRSSATPHASSGADLDAAI